MDAYERGETPHQLQALIDLTETLPMRFVNVIYESLTAWAECGEYPDGTVDEWKTSSRYDQAGRYIAWMRERGKRL